MRETVDLHKQRKKRRAVIFSSPSCLFHDNSWNKSRHTNTCSFSTLMQKWPEQNPRQTLYPEWTSLLCHTGLSGSYALKYRPLPKWVILGQGRSVDWARWNHRWHTNTSRAQAAGTLHSLQEAAALYCGMFWDLVASSTMLHIKIQVNGLNKTVEKDKNTSVSDRAFPYRPHLWMRRIISICIKMNAISSTVSVPSCF